MDEDYSQYINIWAKGVVQCYSYGNAVHTDTDNNSPSCSCVVELSVGDEVFVVSNEGSARHVHEGKLAGFTGFLIRPY